jgi:hypothetical protein
LRRAVLVAILVACLGALAYLRDPPWQIDQTSGLRSWQQADGRRFRWSGGHASFFVPSNARQIRIPVATTFDERGSEPMIVSFSVDDRKAAGILLTDDRWQDVILDMPARGSRRVRRIDLRTNVTREDNHGVRIGELAVTSDGRNWRPCCK